MTATQTINKTCYLAFGIGKNEDALDTALSSISQNGITVYYNHVPENEYGEQNLDQHIQDMDWLEKNVIEYHSHMDELRRKTTFIPFQFGTVYKSKKSMEKFLQEHGNHFQDDLNYFSGKSEWGVKVFLSNKLFRKWVIKNNTTGSAENDLMSGAAFFKKKKTEYEALAHENETLAGILEDIKEKVNDTAIECKEIDFLEMSNEDEKTLKPVFNLSLLINNNSNTALTISINKLIDEYGKCGVIPRLSGPWPPYNFVNREQ